MTTEAALRQAEAEGLTLLRAESSNSGYRGVVFNSGKPKPYHAKLSRGGKQLNLGYFATPEEAALAHARTPEAQAVAAAAAPPAPPPMTAEEALRQAEEEGLTLLWSAISTGYKGVHSNSSKTKPYRAVVTRGGKHVNIGYYTTAEEAALVVARWSAAQAAAPEQPASSSRRRKVKSEDQPPDMPAGARVKLEEQPPPMPSDARVKLEF